MEFRQLTLERLQKFVAQRYFVTKDYLNGEVAAAQVIHCGMVGTHHASVALYSING